MSNNARGDCISAYSPPFAKGAKVYAGQMRAYALTGTVVSANVTYALAHGLSGIPKIVILSPMAPLGDITAKVTVAESTASARTSTNIYYAGSLAGAKFSAYILI